MKLDKNENSGYSNSGYMNSGNRNSGYWNSGNRNSGDWNSGYSNSGNSNSGYRNSGYMNSGNRNSGYWNSGNRNSGNWNSGNRNSGYMNSDEPTVRMFNKDTGMKRSDITFPDFFFFGLNAWVLTDDMTDKEKSDNAFHVVTGGFLRATEYKKAFIDSWNNTTQEDRDKVFKLPNFDAEIFKEISGIDVAKGATIKVECDGKTVEISRDSAKALNLI